MQKAYRESPHLYVDRWDTPILCIHGQRDFRIEYTQAESAFAAARMRGLPSDQSRAKRTHGFRHLPFLSNRYVFPPILTLPVAITPLSLNQYQ